MGWPACWQGSSRYRLRLGGLLRYFETEFGTRSIGITNTPSQADYAEKHLGVSIHRGDFSEAAGLGRTFDLVTIIGMMEHLAPARQTEMFEMIHKILKPGGRVYLQCVAKPRDWIGGDLWRLSRKYIFPDGDPQYPDDTVQRAESHGFRLLPGCRRDDAKHYARTTEAWVRNIVANRDRFIEMVASDLKARGDTRDPGFIYRLQAGYMALASAAFDADRGCLMRFMFEKR